MPLASPNCQDHQYTINVASDMRCGRLTARYPFIVGDTLTINGQLATTKTAPRVLKQLMSPSNTGIGP